MITLHIAKLLANAGFGILDLTGNTANADIFWEEVTLDSTGQPKQGIWIVPRGAPVTRFNSNIQPFDIYSRYTNKVTGSKKLEDILQYLQEAYGEVCELPTVPPYSLTEYSNVRITPTSSVENAGTDENNKIVRVISGEVTYERN